MGDIEDRLERLTALLYGPTRRTPAAEAQERRAEIARLYLLWTMGEIEKPDDLHEEDRRLWALMESYEEAGIRVADRVASRSV